jgi:aryl-alcohol dehydrogenase-like predicted oxidoreductase
MNFRQFGRTGWQVSEIGYGMWGMGGWTESDDAESLSSLQAAVDLGCNFFDTAYIYGNGHSEGLLGRLLKANPDKKLFTATKIPPLNPVTPESKLDECFPSHHVEEYIHKSLGNLGIQSIDLIQFHFWQDAWAEDDRWSKTMDAMKRQGLVRAVGISVNRGQPWNALHTVQTGLLDSVQVVYNIFDQNPEDELFPACREHNVAVIARVPFDEGSLTGTLTTDSRWPEGDWRNTYFTPEKLKDTLERVDRLKTILPSGMTLPELALRFILSNPDVSTVIPGMRKTRNVTANLACSDAGPLLGDLHEQLKSHR